MISFPCPYCTEGVCVGEDIAGRASTCAACGKAITIPNLNDLAAASTSALKRASGGDSGTGDVAEPLPAPRGAAPPTDPAVPPGNVPAPLAGLDGETVTGSQGRLVADLDEKIAALLAPPRGPDEIGRLGPYRVLSILGRGGMGVVFRAEDPGLKRLVALKAMLPSLARNEASRKRFIREARAAAAIKDDHVVSIFQVSEDGPTPFVAMEFLQGEPLDARIRRMPRLTLVEILRIGREASLGLAAAHDQALVHRDIKPGNLWLEERAKYREPPDGDFKRVKILDFGLARARHDDVQVTQSGVIVGTPAYMSPEQADGRPVDSRSDLFSLGCVLYLLCTGKMPFKGSSTLAIMSALALVTPPRPNVLNPEVPPALSDLVMRLLAKKPDDRPESAAVVAATLEEIAAAAAAVETGNRETKRTQTVPPASARRRALRMACTVVACFVAIGLIAFWRLWFSGSTQDRKAPDLAEAIQSQAAIETVNAVAAELKRLNPGFDGNVNHTAEHGKVTALSFVADNVTNISPLSSLYDLRVLSCSGSGYGKCQLADLSPLAQLTLTELNCQFTKVRDLSPLKNKTLQSLNCSFTDLSDVRALEGMEMLARLNIEITKVSDLTPLKDLQHLKSLNVALTPVSDLSPLKGMKLEELAIHGTFPSDLALLRDMPLKTISLDFKPQRDTELLRSIRTLKQINLTPAAEFWKEVNAKNSKP